MHQSVSAFPWPHDRLERVLAELAGFLLGDPDTVLVMDDKELVKQGRHSAGVQRQCCGQLGKRANCQALVSPTLTRGEVPILVALRSFLPDAWVKDMARRRAARARCGRGLHQVANCLGRDRPPARPRRALRLRAGREKAST